MPLLTQSDYGKENNGIANVQTLLWHRMDPALAQHLQHRFMGNKQNVKPEIIWRQLCVHWTPGFERYIDLGIQHGWY
jgi:hypothetical protein